MKTPARLPIAQLNKLVQSTVHISSPRHRCPERPGYLPSLSCRPLLGSYLQEAWRIEIHALSFSQFPSKPPFPTNPIVLEGYQHVVYQFSSSLLANSSFFSSFGSSSSFLASLVSSAAAGAGAGAAEACLTRHVSAFDPPSWKPVHPRS